MNESFLKYTAPVLLGHTAALSRYDSSHIIVHNDFPLGHGYSVIQLDSAAGGDRPD